MCLKKIEPVPVVLDYSGHKSCVSQDSRLYLARLFSQDLNCKTCKTKIHKKTLFFRPKMGYFQKIVQMRVEKKFLIIFFMFERLLFRKYTSFIHQVFVYSEID